MKLCCVIWSQYFLIPKFWSFCRNSLIAVQLNVLELLWCGPVTGATRARGARRGARGATRTIEYLTITFKCYTETYALYCELEISLF